jgi:hypothetical protein
MAALASARKALYMVAKQNRMHRITSIILSKYLVADLQPHMVLQRLISNSTEMLFPIDNQIGIFERRETMLPV